MKSNKPMLLRRQHGRKRYNRRCGYLSSFNTTQLFLFMIIMFISKNSFLDRCTPKNSCGFAVAFFSTHDDDDDDNDETTSKSTDDEDDNTPTIELNPDYVKPEKKIVIDINDDDDDDDGDDDDDDEQDKEIDQVDDDDNDKELGDNDATVVVEDDSNEETNDDDDDVKKESDKSKTIKSKNKKNSKKKKKKELEELEEEKHIISSSNNNKTTKSIISETLQKSKNTKAIKVLTNNKRKIILGLMIYTFHKEILKVIQLFLKCLFKLIYTLISIPIIDTSTGKIIGRKIILSPIMILKVIFFFRFMFNTFLLPTLQSEDDDDDEYNKEDDIDSINYNEDGEKQSFPISPFHQHHHNNNPLLKQLKKLMDKSKNTAYIPPIEQHWTFERINNRYEKDSMALLKAMGMSSDKITKSKGKGKGTKLTTTTTTSSETTDTNSTATTNSEKDKKKSKVVSMFKGMMKKVKKYQLNDCDDNDGDGPKKVTETDPSSTDTSGTDGTVIIMDLTKLGISIPRMDLIQDQVSFLLSQHQANQTRIDNNNNNHYNASSKDKTTITATTTSTSTKKAEMEIIILLESAGGSAIEYGLVAQQILRLRNVPGIKVTICIDKVAASGGYMIAVTGTQIIAAPFSIVGSIGVYGQNINIHELLQSWKIEDLIFRAGKNKAPIGIIGETTKDGIDNIQQTLDDTHLAFKTHVINSRPILKSTINDIATGDIWLGMNAIQLNLIDKLMTSDEYITERISDGATILKLIPYHKSRPFGFFTSTQHYPYSSSLSSLRGGIMGFLQRLFIGVGSRSSGGTSIPSLAVDSLSSSSSSSIQELQQQKEEDFVSSLAARQGTVVMAHSPITTSS